MPWTVHQQGLGKWMEFHWPWHDAYRTRVPLYENSRRHVIWDHRLRRWILRRNTSPRLAIMRPSGQCLRRLPAVRRLRAPTPDSGAPTFRVSKHNLPQISDLWVRMVSL